MAEVIELKDPVKEELEAIMKEVESAGTDEDVPLYDFAMKAWRKAVEARQEQKVDQRCDQAWHAYRQEYTSSEKALLSITDENDLFAAIATRKARALQMWLNDVFGQAKDRPWVIRPTPRPSMPGRAEQTAAADLLKTMPPGHTVSSKDLAQLMKQAPAMADPQRSGVARDAVERMSRYIDDQLTEAGWKDALEKFFVDLSIYPNAFLKGPFLTVRPRLRWIDGELKEVDEPVIRIERVSPYDIYPSPTSTTTQDGAFIIERMRLKAEDLRRLTRFGSLGYVTEALEWVLKHHPDGWLARYPDGVETPQVPSVPAEEDGNYEVLIYYGVVPTRILDAWKTDRRDLSEEDRRAGDVENVEVWVTGQKVIRVVRLDERSWIRPIYTCSFASVPGRFWGESPITMLRSVQRMANSCFRSLASNMAMAAGPMIEVDTDRLVDDDEEGVTIGPWRVFTVSNRTASGNVASQPVVRPVQIDSNSRELIAVYDRMIQEADDITGIPAYIVGDPQVAGAGRTLGGLAMLMGNAAKGIKQVVSAIDSNIIEPLITALYRLNMRSSPDESIKADAQVVARGASGLLQRNLMQARALELLQVLAPFVQSGIVPPAAITFLLRQIIEGMGYDPDQLMPDTQGNQQQLAQVMQMLGMQQGQPAMPQDMPVPQPSEPPQPEEAARLQGMDIGPPQPEPDGRSRPPDMPDETIPAP